MKLTSSKVSKYISQLHSTNSSSDFKNKAIKLGNYLNRAIQGEQVPFSENSVDDVYSLLGYHAFLGYYDAITITSDNFESYHLFNKLISKVVTKDTNNDIDKQLVDQLQQFQKSALEPALTLYSSLKRTALFLPALQDLCSNLDKLNIGNARYQAIKNWLAQQDQLQSAQFSAQASNTYTKDRLIASFYFSALMLGYKKTVTSEDILELKDKAMELKEHLLHLPEVTAINQYAPLFNVLCNFINQVASIFFRDKRPFVSENTQRVNQYFSIWQNSFNNSVKTLSDDIHESIRPI